MKDPRKVKAFFFLIILVVGTIVAYAAISGSSLYIPPIGIDTRLVSCDAQINNPLNPFDTLHFKSVSCNVISTGCMFPFAIWDAASGKVEMVDSTNKVVATADYSVALHADATVNLKACVAKSSSRFTLNLKDASSNLKDSEQVIV